MQLKPVGVTILTVALWAAGTTVAAGPRNIFDDDWTPPTPIESARPAAPVKPAAPPLGGDAPRSPPVDTTATTRTATTTTTTSTTKEATAVATPVARRPVPTKPQQAAVRKVLREAFAQQLVDRSIPARRQLAEALLEQAAKSEEVPVEQFVLLAAAIDAGTEASNLPLAFRARDQMAVTFSVDALAGKVETVTKFAPRPGAGAAAPDVAAAAENVRAGLELARQLADAEDFGAAQRVCAALVGLSSPVPALKAEVQRRQRDLTLAREVAERVARNVQKLKSSPNDPVANLEVGRHLCFVKADWANGLLLLARGGDEKLRALAKRELAVSGAAEDPEAQAALADAWWEMAQVTTGSAKPSIRAHAAEWYAKAAPGLKGLAKAKVDGRLAEYAPFALKGVVLHLTFDKASQQQDRFRNEAIAETYATVTGGSSVPGVHGEAWLFSGKESATFPLPPGVVLTERTVCAWVALTELDQVGSGVVGVCLDRDGDIEKVVFDSIVYNEQPSGWFFGSDFLRRSKSTNVLEKEQGWVHVAITYARDRTMMYRNGQKIGSMEGRPLLTYADGSVVRIGTRHKGFGLLKGAVDDVLVVDRVLSEEELARLAVR